MNKDLRSRVRQMLDEVIRLFNPEDLESYRRWDTEFGALETELAGEGDLSVSDLTPQVRAQRVYMAFEAGSMDSVLDLSKGFRRAYPANAPTFFIVLSLRARALHLLSSHEEEICEILEAARDFDIRGGELLVLLESLAKRHPGSIPREEVLQTKVQRAIEDLRAQGYDSLPLGGAPNTDLERSVLNATAELRRVNLAKAQAILAEGAL